MEAETAKPRDVCYLILSVGLGSSVLRRDEVRRSFTRHFLHHDRPLWILVLGHGNSDLELEIS